MHEKGYIDEDSPYAEDFQAACRYPEAPSGDQPEAYRDA